MDRARPRDGFLDARRDFEAEVPRHVRVLGTGHDHAPDVAEALERVRGEDAVDGVEGVATPVRIDIVWATRQVLGEARGDLVRIARSEERRVGKACRLGCRSRGSPYH